jgi:hypothetical protein
VDCHQSAAPLYDWKALSMAKAASKAKPIQAFISSQIQAGGRDSDRGCAPIAEANALAMTAGGREGFFKCESNRAVASLHADLRFPAPSHA